jgi:general secretion pathway protein C
VQTSGIERVGAGEFRVDRALVDNVLRDPADILRTPIAPAVQDGRVTGFRILDVKPGSLIAGLGLASGDVLRGINGLSLDSPEAALRALARLRDARDLDLDVRRGERDVRLAYAIR